MWYSGGEPLPPEETEYVLERLRYALGKGKEVMVVEYLDDPALISRVVRLADGEGFMVYPSVSYELDEIGRPDMDDVIAAFLHQYAEENAPQPAKKAARKSTKTAAKKTAKKAAKKTAKKATKKTAKKSAKK